jgi:ABC-2 type transport system ATP-binding protein
MNTQNILLLARSATTAAPLREMERLRELAAALPDVGKAVFAFAEEGTPSLRSALDGLMEGGAPVLIVPILVPAEPAFVTGLKRALQRWRAADAHAWPEIRIAPFLADQPPMLYDFLTVAEHLAFVGETRGESDGAGHRRTLSELGIGGIAERLCRELSFGMRQRVGLAAALIGGVKAVLLDETLNGLDPRAAKAARDVLRRAADRGVAILMSTHLLGVAERLCGRILIMDQGQLRTDVAGAALAALVAEGPGAIERLYLSLVVDAEP